MVIFQCTVPIRLACDRSLHVELDSSRSFPGCCFEAHTIIAIDVYKQNQTERSSFYTYPPTTQEGSMTMPTELSPPSDFLLFLDEIPMPFRPEIKPNNGDREAFRAFRASINPCMVSMYIIFFCLKPYCR